MNCPVDGERITTGAAPPAPRPDREPSYDDRSDGRHPQQHPRKKRSFLDLLDLD